MTPTKQVHDARHMKQGMRLPTYDLITIQEKRIFIPDGHHTVHLQFRRFAGCPICKLHLQTIAQRHQELVQANIIEVVVFHSASAILRQHVHNLPFAVVADPDKKLYHAFGVETSWRSVGDPRAWPSILRGLARFGPGREPGESVLGLPADFLISPNGELMACKYGAHADDHWSVDEILERSCGSLLGPAKPSCA